MIILNTHVTFSISCVDHTKIGGHLGTRLGLGTRSETSVHKEGGWGRVSEAVLTLLKHCQAETVWLQKCVCVGVLEVQHKTCLLNSFLWALSNLLAVTDLTGILLVLLASVPPNTGL